MTPRSAFRAAGLAALLVIACPLPGWTQSGEGKKYALLVGVKKYKHDSLPDLEHTENDAEELASVLKGKPAGFDEVVLLTSTRGEKDDKAKPTAANIRAEMKRLVKKVDKDDLVLIGLAGHGLQITITDPKDANREKAESFFCPADARPTRSKKLKEHEETMIPLFELFNQLEDSGAGVKLLLADCCRDEPKLGRSVDVDNLPRPPRGTAALFSCKSGERAFETPKLGKGHGVFFHHVIEGLKGKAKNNRGEVTWNSLSDYVCTEVSEKVPTLIGAGAKQTPHEIKNLTGKPPVLLGVDDGVGHLGFLVFAREGRPVVSFPGEVVRQEVQRNDEIHRVNGEEVKDVEALLALLRKTRPAQKVAIRIRRGNKEINVELMTERMPAGRRTSGISQRQALELVERVKPLGTPHWLESAEGPALCVAMKSAVTDEDVKRFTELEHIGAVRSLLLDDTKVTNKGVAHLTRLTNLESLSLFKTRVTDDGLSPLARLKSLQGLGLAATSVSDEGMIHLQPITTLRWLHVGGTKVSETGIAALKKAIPDLRVHK